MTGLAMTELAPVTRPTTRTDANLGTQSSS